MEILKKDGSNHTIKLEEGDQVQLLVPASLARSCVHLSVINGQLSIVGPADIICEIKGRGMRDKFKE